jgi:hypothetical protein
VAVKSAPTAFVCLVLTALALGHGSVDQRLTALDAEIKKSPNDAALFLQRGATHAEHEDWTAAEADFAAAEKLVPNLAERFFARGQALLDGGKAEEARVDLEKYCATEKPAARGWAALGRARAKVEMWAGAAAAYERACAGEMQVEWVIEWTRALQKSGNDDGARTAIEAGIARLGPLITLHNARIELEEHAANWPAALEQIERASKVAGGRAERWLIRRSVTLERAGRVPESVAALEEAAAIWEKLPDERKAQAGSQVLKRDIDSALARLRQKGP